MKALITLWAFLAYLVSEFYINTAAAFSPEEERLVGRLFDQAIHEQFVLLEDKGLELALSEMGSKLTEASGERSLQPTFRIINDPVPNAFSGPGAYIYVTTGLLDILSSKDELVAVLATEFAHIIAQDQMTLFDSAKTKREWVRGGIKLLYYLTAFGGQVAAPVVGGVGFLTGAGASIGSMAATTLTVGRLPARVPGTSQIDEVDIANQIAALTRQRQAAFQQGRMDDYERLGQELDKLEKRQKAFIEQLKTLAPQYAAIKYPTPVAVSEIPLRPSEVLVRYEVTDDKTFVWLVKNKRIVKMVDIPIGREELHRLVKQYVSYFTNLTNYAQLDTFEPAVGKRLYELLIKDILRSIDSNETITIVPDDILEILPFEALVVEHPVTLERRSGPHGSYAYGVRYVGDEYTLNYYYSATSLAVIRALSKSKTFDKPLLVLADPLFSSNDVETTGANEQVEYRTKLRQVAQQEGWEQLRTQFSPLPLTSDLAQHLETLIPQADLLLKRQASERELRKKIENKYQYVVFATHGVLAKEVPYIQEPALVLSQAVGNSTDRDNDGFLTMTEVMKLNAPSDVVALTACNTGMGLNVSGEGVMGMGRAFQYAGANSVLVSLWSVEDQSTNLLTEGFLTYLKQGKNKLNALRLARSDLRKAGYEHPFYWAPFILVGEK